MATDDGIGYKNPKVFLGNLSKTLQYHLLPQEIAGLIKGHWIFGFLDFSNPKVFWIFVGLQLQHLHGPNEVLLRDNGQWLAYPLDSHDYRRRCWNWGEGYLEDGIPGLGYRS